MKNIGTLVFLFVVLSIGSFAQTSEWDEGGKNELSVWGGFSPDSSTAISAFGRLPDSRFGIVGVRYSRRFNTGDIVNLRYTADLVPAAVLSYPTLLPPPFESRNSAYAFGAAPLGVRANFRPRKKVQPFVGITGGMLYFNKQVPSDLGARFAFTADLSAGIDIRLRNGQAVTFGYKYYHISNGDRGEINPGIDNNVFFIGYTFFSK